MARESSLVCAPAPVAQTNKRERKERIGKRIIIRE
jgi:hypothetical protein